MIAELCHTDGWADRQTDRYDEAFRNFTKAANKRPTRDHRKLMKIMTVRQ